MSNARAFKIIQITPAPLGWVSCYSDYVNSAAEDPVTQLERVAVWAVVEDDDGLQRVAGMSETGDWLEEDDTCGNFKGWHFNPAYANPDGLVGSYAHSIEDGRVQGQCHVIGNPEPGWYLVQWFEWALGEPSTRTLARIEDMAAWMFYASSEAMRYSYQFGRASGLRAREGGK